MSQKLVTKSKVDKIFYLATPYTHSDKAIKRQRGQQALDAAVELLRLGIYVFSPIAYNAPMENHNLPSTWDFWEDYDKAFVRRCDAILVYQMDGWDKSVGVTAEIEYAKELGMEVFYLTPEQLANGDVDFLVKNEPVQLKLFDSSSRL